MEKIALPKKIEFKQNGNINESLVIVEPLYPGYGNTIGNALRRVLLSSLPGSAVVGVKIKGAKHEFMALPGIKEDVLDIVLNLKQLKIKILNDTEDVLKLELNVQGKKVVTAKDIKKDSQIEIVNPDLVLATITDQVGSLGMEIYVANGRGYSLPEKNKKDGKEVDYMEIDSIYTPVIGVNYKVENVRVGKMTNWDKLVLDIKTDGTISVEDAFNQSVQILIDQFNSLLTLKNEKNKVDTEEVTPVEVEAEVEEEVKTKKKSTKTVKEKK
ncbi:MAG TPA: DNA-directed RNA polymerase subunit alpha [bacterium]|nr:DNA-directed RNA polymerase subunit alpha [bacterium]